MSSTAIIQAQSPAGNWREVGRCSNNAQIISNRLADASKKYNQRVRAVDTQGRVLDLM